MTRMPHPSRLARFVLGWFLLWLGVAMAAPLLQAPATVMVCTGGSVKPLALDDGTAPTERALQCPMCLARSVGEIGRAHV